MYTVIIENDNLRQSEARHKLLLEVDGMVKNKKIFTLVKLNSNSKRNRHARCDIYDKDGNITATLCSTMNSYPDAIRNIKRQLGHLKINNHLK